ncbi:MAG: glycoside hydrolase family 13 protein [Kouleothrix sp.]|nr:glycoside hydrolase family 13 protein [Kouleothrix sp.]
MTEIVTPEWVKHAVFYQIFPDRFAKSGQLEKPSNLEPWDGEPTPHGYKGGDLLGVIEHLNHIQDLGATAIYLCPIFQSTCNHRYHTHDYYRVDPLLGGDEAFDALLAECKRRGLRVVLDGVFNHASRGFFQFNDVLENGAGSPWLDWFSFAEHPANAYDLSRPPGYAAWIGLHALPKLNTDNPQVREYIMRVGEYWMRKGIDGWRLDVPFEIKSAGFWQEFRRRIKAINPEAYIVGEVWWDSREWLQGDQFDGVMNYLFAEAAISFSAGRRVRRELVENLSYAPWPGIGGVEYANRIDRLLGLYPWPIQLTQLNLLDSHDTARFITIAGGDQASVRLGTLLMMTFPGAPSIYYGDEIGLAGGLDPECRRTIAWDRPATWDMELYAFYKQAIALCRSQPALSTGAYRRVLATADVVAFARTLDATTLLVAVNAADEPRAVEAPLGGLAARQAPPAVLFGEGHSAEIQGATLRLALAPRSGIVLDVSAGRP